MSSETNVYQMKGNNMSNIHKKLYNACNRASSVVKADKNGAPFSPLLHDDVQRVAMAALLENGLYPTCNYITDITDRYVVVTCTMRITDIDDPKSFVVIDGCTAMGGLDKYGTGQAMSYSRKYAFLNALNLNLLSKATPRAPQNFLRTIAEASFPDSEGIQLEGSELDTLRLDGIEPIPAISFFVLNATATSGTDAGDNILLESNVSPDTSRLIMEDSSFSFNTGQVQSIGNKMLIEDSLKTYDSIPLSEFEGLRIFDIRRQSKILLGQPSNLLTENNRNFTNKIIEEFDSVSPLELEDNSGFFNLEDGETVDELLSNRGLDNGTSDINQAGVDDSDGIKLEIDGFLKLDGHLITSGELTGQVVDSDEFIISEKTGSANERFILEEDGVIVAEAFSTNSVKEGLLMEDATMVPGARMKAEKSTQKNFADAFLLEDAAQEVATDALVLNSTDGTADAGFKVLSEQDIDDAAILVENILLESSTIFAEEGQIPHSTFELSGGPKKFNKDMPQLVITLGSQPIVKSSVIEVRSA